MYFEEWFEMQHWDVSLFRALEKNVDLRTRIGGACFCFPSVGHYVEHVSGTEGRVREPGWTKWWCQEGTRRLNDEQKDRHLYEWSEKGQPPWLCQVDLPSASPQSLDWLTLRPTLDAAEEEEHEAEQVAGKSKQKGKRKNRGRAVSRRNRSTPGLEGLQRSNVVDYEEEGPPMTKSQQRRRRAYLQLYSRRVFTDDAEEACGRNSLRVPRCFVQL